LKFEDETAALNRRRRFFICGSKTVSLLPPEERPVKHLNFQI
jgi:hypothetical protein